MAVSSKADVSFLFCILFLLNTVVLVCCFKQSEDCICNQFCQDFVFKMFCLCLCDS